MLEARRASQIDFAPDGTPIVVGNSNAGGLPLFSIIQVPLNSERLGFLSLAKDNGLLSGDVFVDAYNELVKLSLTGNEPSIITMAEYEAEILTEGKCDKFGLSIADKQFKIPFVPDVFLQMKLYGTLTNKAQVDMVDIVTQLTGKLDTSIYNSNAWSIAKASARVDANGSITANTNITSCTRISTGQYQITFMPGIFSDSNKMEAYIVGYHTDTGGVGVGINSISTSQMRINIVNWSGVPADYPFNIRIYEGK